MQLKSLLFCWPRSAFDEEPEATSDQLGAIAPWDERRRLGAKRALALLATGALALGFSACTRTVTNEPGDVSYDSVEQANATLQSSQGVSAYGGSWEGKVHFAATTTQTSYARGVVAVNTPNGYDDNTAAAFYFPTGTLSGSSPKLKGDIDVLRWDNQRTQDPNGTNFDRGGIRISGSDHMARLVRQQGTNVASTIGTPFRLQEGCWNWVWVHERLSSGSSGEPAPISEVLLNGEKIVRDTTAPNNFARGVDDVKIGLVSINASAQSGTPLDFYVDDATLANESGQPRANACEPQSGARPYYSFDSQGLNDRMSVGVNLSSGNLHLQANDLRIAGTGLDLELSRYYDSQLQNGTVFGALTLPGLGPHWTTNVAPDVHLTPTSEAGGAIFHGPGGYVMSFKSPNFAPPSGLNAKLTKDSSDGTYKLKFNRSGIVYRFNPDGWLSSIEDQNHNTISFQYASSSQLGSITDTQGRQVTFTYSSGKLTKVHDSAGNRDYNYAYTGTNLTSYTDPENPTTPTTYAYLSDGRLKQIKDPLQNQTNITYDPNYPDRVATIERKSAATGESHITSYSYTAGSPCDTDTNGHNKTVVTDANNHQITYCSDDMGRIHHVEQPVTVNGTQRTLTHKTSYTPNSDLEEYTGPGAASASLGANASFSYDQNDSPTGSDVATDLSDQAKDLHTGLTYNAPQPATNPSADYPKYYPDTSTDEQGNNTHFEYDDRGNVTRVYDPIGDIRLVPNSQGNITSSVDGEHHVTGYGYDPAGNLITVTPPPPLPAQTFTYDPVSRVQTFTDGKGQLRSYTYDKLDRLKTMTYTDTSNATTSTSYTYDVNGNLKTEADTTGSSTSTSSYNYDGFNQLVTEQVPNGRVDQHAYDPVGNLKQTYDDDQEWITYRYDEADRLISVEEPNGSCTSTPTTLCTTFKYDDNGNRTETKYPNGVTMSASYDDADRIKNVHATGPSNQSLTSHTYSYAFPNGSGGTVERALVRSVNNDTYDYDARNRLKQVNTYPRYDYDAANNLILEQSSQTISYQYGGSNELLLWNHETGSAGYTYDLNGNLASETKQFRSGSPSTLELRYNVRDQTASIKPFSTSTRTSLSYLGQTQQDLVSQVTGSSTAALTNNMLGLSVREDPTVTFYLRDNEGKLIARRPKSGSGYYYLFDGQGSVVGLTDSQGQLVRSYSYDAWGNLTSNTGSGPVDFMRYAGGYQTEAGLYHFGMRYYDPENKRWTQEDPVAAPDDLIGQNRYAYVGDDPVNATDMLGLFFLKAAEKIIEKRFRTGERFIFSKTLKTRQAIGRGGIKGLRAFGYLQAAQFVWNCSKKLSGGDLAGQDQGPGCDPLAPEPAY
jgi:RHS repeat-associated protein